MTITREWATPLAAGAFLLVAATGVLMFFHLDSGLNKEAHEWLSWALLAGVGLHVTSNLSAFKRHLAGRRGQAFLGVFALLLALSFIPLEEEGEEKPFMAPVRALAGAPIATLAQVANTTPETVMQRLQAAGFKASAATQSVSDLTGKDPGDQMRALNAALKAGD
ncbi:MAG TPA: DUF4405 domain-containing protein [Fluviicoccus sp.]|nr:DUF4405 domain-containing protein [Fluviicoccus sp.]